MTGENLPHDTERRAVFPRQRRFLLLDCGWASGINISLISVLLPVTVGTPIVAVWVCPVNRVHVQRRLQSYRPSEPWLSTDSHLSARLDGCCPSFRSRLYHWSYSSVCLTDGCGSTVLKVCSVVKVEVCSRGDSGRDTVGIKGRGREYPLLRGIPLPIWLWGCEIPSGVRGRAPAEKVWCILFVIENIWWKKNSICLLDILTHCKNQLKITNQAS